jgi:hypothetical protein
MDPEIHGKLNDLVMAIKKRAEERARQDDEDFCADDYGGGNVDDAFAAGVDDGEILFARELAEIAGIPLTISEE